MTPFEHVAVLVSIILGLGVTQLLAGVHRLAQARRRVRLYWLPLVWVALLFVSQVGWWWGFFELRHVRQWNFFYVLFVILSPVTLFLASAFALPEIEPREGYDLRETYYEGRRWFFTLVALGPALDGVRRGVEAGSVADLGAASNLVSAALVGSLAASRRPSYHAIVTFVVAGLFGFFIVSSALQLREDQTPRPVPARQ